MSDKLLHPFPYVTCNTQTQNVASIPSALAQANLTPPSRIPPVAASDDDPVERLAWEVFGLPAEEAKRLLRKLAKELGP